jgi:hypothetical protein
VGCLREVIAWLSAAADMAGPEAYALASMAVSFRVTQYARQTSSAYTSVPPHAGREALRTAVGPVWAAEGPGTLHLTLNPVVEPGPADGQAVAPSVLLIIDPAKPSTIRAAALITEELCCADGSWRITRRTVTPAAGQRSSRPRCATGRPARYGRRGRPSILAELLVSRAACRPS